MPHRTWPSTSIPSTSSGSRKRSDEKGNIAREAGSASPGGRREDADDLGLLEAPPYRSARGRGVHEPARRPSGERLERGDDLDLRRRSPTSSSASRSTVASRSSSSGSGLPGSPSWPPCCPPSSARITSTTRSSFSTSRYTRKPDGRGPEVVRHSSSARRSSSVSRRRMTRRSPRARAGRPASDAVVVRGHRQRVRAGRGHCEQVAPAGRRGATSSMRTSPDSQCIPATLTVSPGCSPARDAERAVYRAP